MKDGCREQIASLLFFAVGIAFLVEAAAIDPGPPGLLGAGTVPLAVSAFIVCASAVAFFRAHRGSRPENREGAERSSIRRAFGKALGELVVAPVPIAVLGLAYVVLFGWFGYLLATGMIAFAAFLLFRNGLKQALIHSVLASVVLHLFFIELLGVFDPGGTVLDVRDLLGL